MARIKYLSIFSIKFLAASLLFFLIWDPFTYIYARSLTPVANLIATLTHHPVQLQIIQGQMALTYLVNNKPFHIYLGNQDVVYLNIIILTSLFIASGLTRSWRYWISAFGLLYMSHIIHFHILSYVGIWRYFRHVASSPDQLSPHLHLAAEAASQFLPDYAHMTQLNLILDFWRNWGMMALAFIIWFLCFKKFTSFLSNPSETSHAT